MSLFGEELEVTWPLMEGLRAKADTMFPKFVDAEADVAAPPNGQTQWILHQHTPIVLIRIDHDVAARFLRLTIRPMDIRPVSYETLMQFDVPRLAVDYLLGYLRSTCQNDSLIARNYDATLSEMLMAPDKMFLYTNSENVEQPWTGFINTVRPRMIVSGSGNLVIPLDPCKNILPHLTPLKAWYAGQLKALIEKGKAA